MHYSQLFEYLRTTLASSSSRGDERSMHGQVKRLNAVTGLYWIVGTWKLVESLDRTPPDSVEMHAKFACIFKKLLESTKLFPKEDGGLLRCFSAVQLSVMLSLGHAEISRISSATLDMLGEIFTVKKFPFWFDMRSMYCLVGILKLTNQLDTIGAEQRLWLRDWIYESQAILGGFGANPKAEAHGGYTFCAVSSLRILGYEVPRQDRLLAWCKCRLTPRFNGRPGKPSDSCYIWWICATLKNIEKIKICEKEKIQKILWENFFVHNGGGFSKYPSIPIPGDDQSVHGQQDADLFHTFLGITSIALFQNKIDSLCVLPLN